MKITRFALPILLSAMLVWTAGCGIFFPFPDWHPFSSHTNPLKEGWTFRPFPGFEMPPYGHNTNRLDQAITDNYQDFLKKNNLSTVGAITGFFEDGTGQHAIQFETGINGTSWVYTLIYDKNNKRIKVMRYVSGHYAC
jgi:hypothetical protein